MEFWIPHAGVYDPVFLGVSTEPGAGIVPTDDRARREGEGGEGEDGSV